MTFIGLLFRVQIQPSPRHGRVDGKENNMSVQQLSEPTQTCQNEIDLYKCGPFWQFMSQALGEAHVRKKGFLYLQARSRTGQGGSGLQFLEQQKQKHF